MLVVFVRGAAGDRADRLHRHEGIRQDDQVQEGPARAGHRRGPHLRPRAARPRRAGAQAPVPHARQVRARRSPPRSRRSSATASASTSPSTRARSPRSAAINIVGNKAFSENELLEPVHAAARRAGSPGTPRTTSTRTQKLQADLETLRSFYLNRGYLDFNIESTQVSITPDKQDIYITINITEGEKYTVSDVKLAGEHAACRESELREADHSSSRARRSRARS